MDTLIRPELTRISKEFVFINCYAKIVWSEVVEFSSTILKENGLLTPSQKEKNN